jgi:integrase
VIRVARKREGQVVERVWKSGRGYALRVVAYGQRHYLTLGLQADGWTRERAEEELANITADVRRGIWIPPQTNITNKTSEPAPAEALTFGAFAGERLARRKLELSQRSYEYEEWALTLHLLPYFATWRLVDITIEAVDAYRTYKVAQAEQRRDALDQASRTTAKPGEALPRPFGASTINKTIDVLQAYLAVAVEYGHLPSNPAAGRRRRLKVPARRPVHLDSVEQIVALLDAAEQLDADPASRLHDRRANIAALIFAGPRAGEHTALRWGDVDLANDRIQIGRSKTQAGLREIHLLPILKHTLAAHKQAATHTAADDLVFVNRDGTARDKDNLRNRVLAPAIERANELLADRDQPPLPAGLSPHKLRHTFASILVACGEDPASVMTQLGHTDPNFTLRIYTHLMRRNPAERARLKALVLQHADDDENDAMGETAV